MADAQVIARSSIDESCRSSPEHNLQHADRDDGRGDAAREREHRGEQDELRRRLHPFARSTTTAVKGAPPFGATVKVRPQWPTMTSAAALRV